MTFRTPSPFRSKRYANGQRSPLSLTRSTRIIAVVPEPEKAERETSTMKWTARNEEWTLSQARLNLVLDDVRSERQPRETLTRETSRGEVGGECDSENAEADNDPDRKVPTMR